MGASAKKAARSAAIAALEAAEDAATKSRATADAAAHAAAEAKARAQAMGADPSEAHAGKSLKDRLLHGFHAAKETAAEKVGVEL